MSGSDPISLASRRQARRVARAEQAFAKAKSPLRIGVLLLGVPLTALAVAVSLTIRTSEYEPADALRDLIARINCDAARSVKLAPAYRGELGYHAGNDADDDGIACEPWPPEPQTATRPASGDIAEQSAASEAEPPRMIGGARFVRVPD